MLDALGSAARWRCIAAGRGKKRFDPFAELFHSRVIFDRALATVDPIQDGRDFQQSGTNFEVVAIQQFGSVHKAKHRVSRSEVSPGNGGNRDAPFMTFSAARLQYTRSRAELAGRHGFLKRGISTVRAREFSNGRAA